MELLSDHVAMAVKSVEEGVVTQFEIWLTGPYTHHLCITELWL
jgi:hypothetical protein